MSPKKKVKSSKSKTAQKSASKSVVGTSTSYDYDVLARVDEGTREEARHGDIFTNNGYRHTETVIACQDDSTGKMIFVKNPDEAGSGYLTIPRMVLNKVTDAVKKYDILITKPELAPCFNMHVSTNDRFLHENLGEQGVAEAEGWDFDVQYVAGQLNQVYIKPPNVAKGKTFPPPFNWAQIKEFFESAAKPMGYFEVKIWLNDEDLKRYIQTYSPGKKFGWISAKPDMGVSWTLDVGRCGTRDGMNHFQWKLEGPEDTMDDAIAKVESWLQGFTYKIRRHRDLIDYSDEAIPTISIPVPSQTSTHHTKETSAKETNEASSTLQASKASLVPPTSKGNSEPRASRSSLKPPTGEAKEPSTS